MMWRSTDHWYWSSVDRSTLPAFDGSHTSRRYSATVSLAPPTRRSAVAFCLATAARFVSNVPSWRTRRRPVAAS
jgi:hypothetical protein